MKFVDETKLDIQYDAEPFPILSSNANKTLKVLGMFLILFFYY